MVEKKRKLCYNAHWESFVKLNYRRQIPGRLSG